MRYMLLIYGCERYKDGSPESEEKRIEIAKYYAMLKERGVFLAADPLHDIETATTVRVRDGEALVTDGPFAETREQLGGYFVLDCANLDEALELAARCPMAAEGSVEVRPILELPPIESLLGEARAAAAE